jgi:HlyD family secretion protein
LQLDAKQLREAERLAKIMGEAIQKAGNNPEARREIARTERQRFARGMDEILTPEQREKYRAMRQARQQPGGPGNAPRNAVAGVPGRVHALDEKGNPKPVALRTGATDGSWTEVLSGEINPGDPLVVGLSASAAKPRQASGFRFGF